MGSRIIGRVETAGGGGAKDGTSLLVSVVEAAGFR